MCISGAANAVTAARPKSDLQMHPNDVTSAFIFKSNFKSGNINEVDIELVDRVRYGFTAIE